VGYYNTLCDVHNLTVGSTLTPGKGGIEPGRRGIRDSVHLILFSFLFFFVFLHCQ